MPSQPQQVAIVTGANRGIGLEVVRQLAQRGFVVVLGSRDLAKGESAAQSLTQQGLTHILPRQVDVADKESVARLASQVETELGRVDVLVNNAAILYDTWERAVGAELDTVRQAFETNTLGAWRMCQAFTGLMRRHRYGRIVNVSSEAGSLASMGSGTPAYNISKAGLNALTIMLAADLAGSGILVNAVCPGWVATHMGGRGGRPVAEGATGIIWAATLPDNGPNGGFFRDNHPLPW